MITLGYANLIIIPFSNIFGRRLTSLICAIVCVLSNIWQAVATSYSSFLAARVVSGLGAAANESIMAVVVADVIFLHQRGSWMGLYLYSRAPRFSPWRVADCEIAGVTSWERSLAPSSQGTLLLQLDISGSSGSVPFCRESVPHCPSPSKAPLTDT